MSSRLLTMLAVISATALGQSPSPVWPKSFIIKFNESTSARGNLDNNATWYYDFANGRARCDCYTVFTWDGTQTPTYSIRGRDCNPHRMDRKDGSKDRFCTGANKGATVCQHLNPGPGLGRYLVFPATSPPSCCFCCTNDFGCGVIQPNWVVNSNGTYQGRAAWKTPFTNFPAVDKWEATGLQTNYYWQSGDAMASPLGLQQGTDDYMYFDPTSFMPGPQADSLFTLPSYCSASNLCNGFCKIGAPKL